MWCIWKYESEKKEKAKKFEVFVVVEDRKREGVCMVRVMQDCIWMLHNDYLDSERRWQKRTDKNTAFGFNKGTINE